MNFYIFEHRRDNKLLHGYGIGPCTSFREATLNVGKMFEHHDFQLGDTLSVIEETTCPIEFLKLCGQHIDLYRHNFRFVNSN